jgi:hypothetical protein
MRQQAKKALYAIAPIVTLVVTVAAPVKWAR